MATEPLRAITGRIPVRSIAHGRVALAAIALLLVVDGVVIAIDATLGSSATYPEALHVYHEGGPLEWYVYLKFLAAAALMLTLVGRARIYAVWTAIFLYLVADDAFMLHERVADRVSRFLQLDRTLDLPFYAWIILEPLYQVAVGIGMLAALWWASRPRLDPAARRFTLIGIGLLAVYGLFSAAFDYVVRVVFDRAHLGEVAEDGGEMIVATLLVALVLLHVVAVSRRDENRAAAG